MGLLIRKLLALQEVDLQIISLNDEKAKRLDSINEKKSEFEEQRAELEEQEAEVKRLKVEMKSMEVELADTSEKTQKLESQQINVKTNQEYKALDKEIYEAKAHRAEIEDQLLQKMELQEQASAQIGERRGQLEAKAKVLEGETASIESKIAELDQGIAELQQKRSEVASGIEDNLLRLYDRIYSSKGAPALVPLVNRACQGCHLAVPAGIESILRRRESDIITCENCSRILYIPVEEDE